VVGISSKRLEEVMRSIVLALCVAMWGTSACAATKEADLGIDFSHAAVKYLIVVENYESAAGDSSGKAQERVDSAYKDLTAAATGDKTSSENKTALVLKIFAAAHIMNLKTYQLTGDRKDVVKDQICISEWKQALLSRSSNQPQTCK
jgi:hypothetical protein